MGATPVARYALLPLPPALSASANKCGLWTAHPCVAAAVSVDGGAPEARAAACVCAGARDDASDHAPSDGDLYRPPPGWHAPPALRLERYRLADAEGTAAAVARRLERWWVKYVSGRTSWRVRRVEAWGRGCGWGSGWRCCCIGGCDKGCG